MRKKTKRLTLTQRVRVLEAVQDAMVKEMKLVSQLPMWGARVGVLEVAVNEHRKQLAAIPAPGELGEWMVDPKRASRRIASPRGRRG